MNKDNKPRFIRRNGKIVPIGGKGKGKNNSPKADKPKRPVRSRKEKRETGFNLLGVGGLTTVLSGVFGAGIFREGSRVKAQNKAATEKNKQIFAAPDLFSAIEKKEAAQRSKITKKKSDRLFKASFNIRRAGILAGSAAIAAGFSNLIDDDRSIGGEVGEQAINSAIFAGTTAISTKAFNLLGKSAKIRALQKFSSTGFTVVRGGN